jgi:geranylgeranyl pyrophosphate synthase
MLNESLKQALASISHHPELLKVMDYAVLPAGKMFRPKLVQALSLDLGKSGQDYLHLGSAIELHHAYTLVHDDLPSMDNDLMRRGKPSTHAAFGEWQAILAGDALLIASFNELMKIKSSRIREIHQLFTWATGAKGLISGQFLDLAAQGKASFNEIIRIHELKTARLIQVATLGTYYLSASKLDKKMERSFLRLGREIGVSFQLMDDLSELTEDIVSIHETEINPFLKEPHLAFGELKRSKRRLDLALQKFELRHLDKMLKEYFLKNHNVLTEKFDVLEKNITDTKTLEEIKSWITTFG